MMHRGGEDGGDDSSEESVNDDEDDDDEETTTTTITTTTNVVVSASTRLLPPPNPAPATMGGSSISNHHHHHHNNNQNNHHHIQPRKNYPPNVGGKVYRASAPVWKTGDEMIGVPVPRKARSGTFLNLFLYCFSSLLFYLKISRLILFLSFGVFQHLQRGRMIGFLGVVVVVVTVVLLPETKFISKCHQLHWRDNRTFRLLHHRRQFLYLHLLLMFQSEKKLLVFSSDFRLFHFLYLLMLSELIFVIFFLDAEA